MLSFLIENCVTIPGIVEISTLDCVDSIEEGHLRKQNPLWIYEENKAIYVLSLSNILQ